MTLLAEVAGASARAAETSSRLAKVRELAGCLNRLAPEEIEIATAFLTGKPRQGRLGIGYATLQDVRGGAGAQQPSLTLREVDAAFAEIAAIGGKGSTGERARRLAALFARATRQEQDFLVRLIAGELRQGALEGLMLEAVATAANLPVAIIRRAAMFAGGIGAVAQGALTEGAAGLMRFSIRLLQPVLPMLAQPVEDTAAALDELGTAALEWKLDGARVQAHKAGDEVRVFTRNLNDVTAAVPEIVEIVRAARARDVILDGEAIALRADAMPRPFQVTMRRFGRKLDIEAMRRELPLSVFFFDCLRRDDEPLVDARGEDRFHALTGILPPGVIIPRLVTADRKAAEAFFMDALRHGHEGVMAKSPEAIYEAGHRGSNWLKVKRALTLDLVVLAAEWGHGRRRGWLSNLHLGARDPNSGGFVMLGKTFKGLTDKMLEWQTHALLQREIARDAWTVYVKPELVVEVAFNEVQASPQYPGGLALRFARVKAYRPDKRPEEADTMESVRRIHAVHAARATQP
jgi:DNA ligase-1